MARAYTIAELKEKATRGDITFDLKRMGFLRHDSPNQIEALKIQRIGYHNESLSWLRSTTPEQMQYGTATREERFAKAAEFASMAAVDLMALAVEAGVEIPSGR